jgi:hypothetical protein
MRGATKLTKLCELCRKQEFEKAYKRWRVNGDDSPYYPKLLAASAKKPTLWIKRLRFAGHSPNNIKLRTAASIPCPEQLKKEREKAAKAMSLNYGF